MRAPDALSQMAARAWPNAWTRTLSLPTIAALRALYASRGDETVSGAFEVESTEDGPIQVAVWDTLTMAAGASITASARPRGLFVICKHLVTQGAASIHMDGKGPFGCSYPDYDLTFPTALALSSRHVRHDALMAMIRETGWFLGDPILWQYELAGLVSATLTPGAHKIVDKTALGAAGTLAQGAGNCGTYYWRKGGPGGAGAGGPGGGSAGLHTVNDNSTPIYCAPGARGNSWGGGPPGNGSNNTGVLVSGDDCAAALPGGVLVVCVTDSVSLGGALVCSADAQQVDLDANGMRLGGAGGGRVMFLAPAAVTSNLTLRANGSTTTVVTGGCSQLSGGAGLADQSTLTDWGLA